MTSFWVSKNLRQKFCLKSKFKNKIKQNLRRLWFVFPLGLLTSFSNSTTFLHRLQDQVASAKDEALILIVMACWGIWMKRNELNFNTKYFSPKFRFSRHLQIMVRLMLLRFKVHHLHLYSTGSRRYMVIWSSILMLAVETMIFGYLGQ